MIELIIVMAVIAIIFGMALPSYVDWRNNENYRKAARELSLALREARSQAIAVNSPYMVVFKPNSSNYRILTGTGYNTMVQTSSYRTPVIIKSGLTGTSAANVYVQFKPNGTAILQDKNGIASDPNVTVNKGTTPRYLITVTNTGRITMQRQ